jgi:hypothetical protein
MQRGYPSIGCILVKVYPSITAARRRKNKEVLRDALHRRQLIKL